MPGLITRKLQYTGFRSGLERNTESAESSAASAWTEQRAKERSRNSDNLEFAMNHDKFDLPDDGLHKENEIPGNSDKVVCRCTWSAVTGNYYYCRYFNNVQYKFKQDHIPDVPKYHAAIVQLPGGYSRDDQFFRVCPYAALRYQTTGFLKPCDEVFLMEDNREFLWNWMVEPDNQNQLSRVENRVDTTCLACYNDANPQNHIRLVDGRFAQPNTGPNRQHQYNHTIFNWDRWEWPRITQFPNDQSKFSVEEPYVYEFDNGAREKGFREGSEATSSLGPGLKRLYAGCFVDHTDSSGNKYVIVKKDILNSSDSDPED